MIPFRIETGHFTQAESDRIKDTLEKLSRWLSDCITFFDDSDSKFSVLSPTFYGISKSRPEGPQFCGFVWEGGAPGGQLWPFEEI